MPDDLAVDNRALLAALRIAAERAGALFVDAAVAAVLDDGTRVVGVRLADGTERAAGTVLVAAGAHSAGLHPALHGLVRPVKGEILRLALRPGAFPLPRRTVRALVDGRPLYLVPRADGIVLGATQSEVGFDTTVTVGGVRDLLRDAERILPGIAEYALVEYGGRPAAGQPGQPAADRRARPRRPAGRHRPPPQRDAARARHRGRGRRPAARRPRWPSRSVRPILLVSGMSAGGIGPYRPLRGGSAWSSGSTGNAGELASDAGVLDALGALGLPRTGVAVAVDGEVVPRRAWAATALADGARVEVLTAVQGG